MIFIGAAYWIPLTGSPYTLTPKRAIANTFLLQPQQTDMCYRYDGVETALCGFLLPEWQVLTVQVVKLVIWAAERSHGRVVVQEVKV